MSIDPGAGAGAAVAPSTGQVVLELVAVVDRLRRECPWDREQTHASLRPYLLEETYEVLEALDASDSTALREELGDLLLQVLLHARLAAEHADDPWGIDDVAAGVRDKMVRRHPHVFAARAVSGVDEVAANWEELKATEKSRASVLDGVPTALPALARADKILGRLDRAGLDAAESAPGTQHAPGGQHGPGAASDAEAEVGAALLRQVRLARRAGVDPEGALRRALREVEARARAQEQARRR